MRMPRLRAARFGFATRRVDSGVPCSLLNGNAVPNAGDVVLARVTDVGHHARRTGSQLEQAEIRGASADIDDQDVSRPGIVRRQSFPRRVGRAVDHLNSTLVLSALIQTLSNSVIGSRTSSSGS